MSIKKSSQKEHQLPNSTVAFADILPRKEKLGSPIP